MADFKSLSSESDSDELDWSAKNRKRNYSALENLESEKVKYFADCSLLSKQERFEQLQKRCEDVRNISSRQCLRTEKRRAKKLIKKALKDPCVKELVESNKSSNFSDLVSEKEEKEKVEWNSIKPFLSVNKHLQGPVSHGEWGPKTELEAIIDDAIKDGDFQKAELLSDTLANKQFAQKICKAFSAKRCFEKLDEQKVLDKAQKMKTIRWTFEAKERWQMKGNM